MTADTTASESNANAAEPAGTGQPTDADLRAAIEFIRLGQLDQAMKLAKKVLIASPDNADAVSVMAQIHAAKNEFREAAELAERLVRLQPSRSGTGMLRAFDWHLRCGDFAAAERNLKQGIALAPDAPELHRSLAQLLNAQGRRFEASEHVMVLVRQGSATANELLSLIDLSGPFPMVSFEPFHQQTEVTLFTLGEARLAYHNVIQRDEAVRQAARVAKTFPRVPAVAAFHGRILAENGDLEGLRRWSQSLPEGIDTHPEYWAAVGHWLSQIDRHEAAIGAFSESLRRDPTDRRSLRLMIASLQSLGQGERTLEAKKNLALLDQIFRRARLATPEDASWIAAQLQSLTRPWESASWYEHAARLSGQLEHRIEQFAQRRATIREWNQRIEMDELQALRLNTMLGFEIDSDQRTSPLAALALAANQKPERANIDPSVSPLRFDDIAEKVGLTTRFSSGYDLESGEFLIYQANGGGLAALDYDLDGRCDIYIVQSGGKPNDSRGSTANQLYRLLPGERFFEVTTHSLTGDQGFGQGVCVGDVNQDGFPDLLVANIGANTLYINQGDGTFRDTPSSLIANGQRWTSSIGVGDLDGDNLPEIVEVNYINDPRAYQIKCKGRQLHCTPQSFRSAADRVLRNRADGSFETWTELAEIEARPNYGFGLVIANLDGEHGNDVFISNDGDLNHFWASTPMDNRTADSRGSRFTMVESAGVRGCSIGANGQSQACMGIAAGDFDRDHRPDLHVTNFHMESVNLFLQKGRGFFVDDALKSGLSTPSLNSLGFGTQAADFDCDGWTDLAVLNGHIYDARYTNIPFRMKPQLLRGSQDGFSLQDPLQASHYWEQRRLARTLAILDWNRDGKTDLLANHLDAPITLLENRSDSGNWLQLELVGVTSERDAIGAEIEVQCGTESWTGWLFGGDGYQCTNEPLIHFGVGPNDTIDQIEVRWPAGDTQIFEGVSANHRYLVVEDNPEIFPR